MNCKSKLFCFYLLGTLMWGESCIVIGEQRVSPADAAALDSLRKVHISISLDRPAYLAGEIARVRLRIINPTSNTLKIPEPLGMNTGRFEVDEKNSQRAKELGVEYYPTVEHACPSGGNFMKRALRAGETYEQVVRSDDTKIFGGFPFYLPSHPGDYRLRYTYSATPVNFRVERPAAVETVATAIVAEKSVVPSGVTIAATERVARHVFVVRTAEGERWLARVDGGPPDWSPMRLDAFRYERLRKLSGATSKLNARLGADGSVLVDYETTAGERDSLKLRRK